MEFQLSDTEVRVLGALLEKETTTPDYYPLSLNALINACNQRSNRDPVMNLGEEEVRQALASLADRGLAGLARGTDSRVGKYEHHLQEVFNLTRGENAVLCVLLLRGAQTPGELRGRTERMHPFDDLDAVMSTLQRLMNREPPLAKILARQPGTKEARYVHLLAGDKEVVVTEQPSPTAPAEGDRVAHLEDAVAGLREELADLKQQFAEMKKILE